MSEAGRPDESRGNARLYPFGRLTKRRDFLAAASGRRFHTERMTVQGRLREDDGTGGLRIGFTLTKRVGNAVVRNRIKRRLRAAVKQLGAAMQEAGNAKVPRRNDAATADAVISPCASDQKEPSMPLSEGAVAAFPAIAADLVVIARRPAIDAPFVALIADLAQALPKVTKPGDPAKRGRGRDGQAGSKHRRRGRGGGVSGTGRAPARNS